MEDGEYITVEEHRERVREIIEEDRELLDELAEDVLESDYVTFDEHDDTRH